MDYSKIVLGTAHFGLDYGIHNERGKVPPEEVFKILNRAHESGMYYMDTATVYGDSEKVIGQYHKKFDKAFKVISKISTDNESEVEAQVSNSQTNLNLTSLYGYLIHHYDDYIKYPYMWDILVRLKNKGGAKKIGFSLYYPFELDYLLENDIRFDIVQVPYSIFDRRFEDKFKLLKDRGVEIHVRSIFLQGLVFIDHRQLDNYFKNVVEKIKNLHELSNAENIPIVALCLEYVLTNDSVDKVIVGVDSVDNLEGIIKAGEYRGQIESILDKLNTFREDDENILIPSKWKIIHK